MKSRLIQAPPRESLFGSVIVISGVGVMTLAFLWPGAVELTTHVALPMLLVVALIGRHRYAIHVTLFAGLLFLPAQYWDALRLWPLNILIPLLGYISIVGLTPRLRKSIGWHKHGRADSQTKRLIISTIILSAFGLIGWAIFFKAEVQHHVALIPKMPFWAYPLAGLGFALLNSTMEEVVFRGIVLEALDSALGAGFGSVAIQAISFAALHYLAGFPNGVAGFVLVLVYGIMLGAIRRASNGLLFPILAHVGADLSIFSILMVF